MILAVPADIPVTTPVVAATLAALPEVLQVPPVDVDASVMLAPEQTLVLPVMAEGRGSTVTIAGLIQPIGDV